MQRPPHPLLRYGRVTPEAPPPRMCEAPGCTCAGEFRAPRDRTHLNEYRWFCLDHVRAYNQAWNYYAGMSDREIEEDWRRDQIGRRPTWRPVDGPGAGETAEKLRARVFRQFGFGGPDGEEAWRRRRAAEAAAPSTETEKALDELGLAEPVTADEIKAAWRGFAKRLHPDVTGGDPVAEEKLKRVNLAYRVLKDAFPTG